MTGPRPGHLVRCVAHVHSTYSDGTATMPELRAAVRAAGARVLLLTDHDSLAARDAGDDGWADDVLTVVGHEVSPRGGHLLVFGTEDVISHAGRDERAILDAVSAAGGVAFAAHPFSAGSAISRRVGRPHPWHVFDHPALIGIEVWSLATDLAEAWRSPLAAWRDLRDPRAAALSGPDPERLRRWDDLDERRTGLAPLAALGGLDAHAPGIRIRGRVRSVMPHERWMGLVQTVLILDEPLSGDTRHDESAVLRALRAGRTAVVVPPLGDPHTIATVLDGEDVLVKPPPGSTVRHVKGPRARRIEVLRPDGGGHLRRWWLGSPRRAARAGSRDLAGRRLGATPRAGYRPGHAR